MGGSISNVEYFFVLYLGADNFQYSKTTKLDKFMYGAYMYILIQTGLTRNNFSQCKTDNDQTMVHVDKLIFINS